MTNKTPSESGQHVLFNKRNTLAAIAAILCAAAWHFKYDILAAISIELMWDVYHVLEVSS